MSATTDLSTGAGFCSRPRKLGGGRPGSRMDAFRLRETPWVSSRPGFPGRDPSRSAGSVTIRRRRTEPPRPASTFFPCALPGLGGSGAIIAARAGADPADKMLFFNA